MEDYEVYLLNLISRWYRLRTRREKPMQLWLKQCGPAWLRLKEECQGVSSSADDWDPITVDDIERLVKAEEVKDGETTMRRQPGRSESRTGATGKDDQILIA